MRKICNLYVRISRRNDVKMLKSAKACFLSMKMDAGKSYLSLQHQPASQEEQTRPEFIRHAESPTRKKKNVVFF